MYWGGGVSVRKCMCVRVCVSVGVSLSERERKRLGVRSKHKKV